MSFLFWKAYWNLIFFDLYLARGNFASPVRASPQASRRQQRPRFPKPPRGYVRLWTWPAFGIGNRCSACSDRQRPRACCENMAFPPQMVIGAQQMPFKAHAWVEAGGRVVNDKPYTPEMYASARPLLAQLAGNTK